MQYDPFYYEDILESGRNKKLKMGPKSYGWRPDESEPSPERDSGPSLHGKSNSLDPGYVEGAQATRLSPPGEGDVFLERNPLENTTRHSPSDSFSDSIQVVDLNGARLNEVAYRPLHQSQGADIQSGQERFYKDALGVDDGAYKRAKDNPPQSMKISGEDFQSISVIDKEGKLDAAQRNEAHIQNELERLYKPTPDVTVAARERLQDTGMAVSLDLGVSTPGKQVHSLKSPVSTARSHVISQDDLLKGKDKSSTNAEVRRDVSYGLCTATGFENLRENQRKISPDAEDVKSGSDVSGDVTAASSLLSQSADLNNEYPDQLDLTPENEATILGSDLQQSRMSPILSSPSSGKATPSNIIVEDLKSYRSSSFADKDLQYDRSSSIAFQDIRNEARLGGTIFSRPTQERPFSSVENAWGRSNSVDRPWCEAIIFIDEQNTELLGIAAEEKLSTSTEAIQVDKPSPEKPTDESLMLSKQCDKALLEEEISTKPEVESSMDFTVDPSSTATAPVRNRIYDSAWPKTESLPPLQSSNAELQRDFGLDNWRTDSLKTKEEYHKEYRSNLINTDITFNRKNDYETSSSKDMTIVTTQRTLDECPQKDTKLVDNISSSHKKTSAQRDSEARVVTFPTKPDIEVIDLETENEYDGMLASQLVKEATSTPIEIENTGNGPFEDDQITKAGDSESILRLMPRPVNRKEGAGDTIGHDIMITTINSDNQEVDNHVDHHIEQSSIAPNNFVGSGQYSAVEHLLAKGDSSLHESDSGSGGLSQSFISALDKKIPKNSANIAYKSRFFTLAALQQQRSFVLEPSASIVQPPENELPTPSMTQTSTAPLLRPNTTKEKPNPPSSKQSGLTSEESVSRIVRDHSHDTLSSPSTNISTAPPLRPSTPDQKHLVVEKLKAIRSRSTKKALARKIVDCSSSAGPWFTYKEPSQSTHVSDSEGEFENVSSSDQVSLIGEVTLSPAPTQNHHMPEPSPSGLRTALSYYAPLSTLLSHFNNLTSVLAIIHSFTPIARSRSGPRDYHQSLYLTDPSSVSSPLTFARIFRSNEIAHPIIVQGDAILLRNFKVQSFQNRVGLLSTNSSAWAVFRQDTRVEVRGPPVEFGPEERSFARGLWNWWANVRIEHGKGEILQMPIVFINNKEDARKRFKDQRKSKPQVVTNCISSTRNATKTHTRKPDVGPSPGPPAKDGGTAQGTPTRNHPRSTSTHGTNSSPVSDRFTLKDGTSYNSGPQELSPGLEVPAHWRGHTPTKTPPKMRGKIAASQASQSSHSSDRHVLRDGTSYESTPTKMVRGPGFNYHELRDGTTYVDDDGGGYTA